MVMLQYSGGSHTSGSSILFGPEIATVERDTVSCVHCQFTWAVQPGSGHKRGFCYGCNGPICGKRRCMQHCIPWEKQCEEIENRAKFWQQMDRMR